VHTGANGGANELSDPTKTADWIRQTLFLATRGTTDYAAAYCHAANMVNTRVGFVLSSYVSERYVLPRGRHCPNDNGALCGGGVFETKGCADNNCRRPGVNTGGSDGLGSYYKADKSKIGASVPGNYNCASNKVDPVHPHADEGCFCKPNGVRSSQVGVWIPQTRDKAGTTNLRVQPGLQLHASGWSAVRVFGQNFPLEDAIEFHAFAPLEASMRVTNGIPLGCSLLLPVRHCNFHPNTKGEPARGSDPELCHTLLNGLKVNLHGALTLNSCHTLLNGLKVNLHGALTNILVEDMYVQNTGDGGSVVCVGGRRGG
jgi:hypothetical protein